MLFQIGIGMNFIVIQLIWLRFFFCYSIFLLTFYLSTLHSKPLTRGNVIFDIFLMRRLMIVYWIMYVPWKRSFASFFFFFVCDIFLFCVGHLNQWRQLHSSIQFSLFWDFHLSIFKPYTNSPLCYITNSIQNNIYRYVYVYIGIFINDFMFYSCSVHENNEKEKRFIFYIYLS